LRTSLHCRSGHLKRWPSSFIVPMTCGTSTVGPEPPSVHIFPDGCKSLDHFCQPFPLSTQDVTSEHP
jgi:hypothetical protein